MKKILSFIFLVIFQIVFSARAAELELAETAVVVAKLQKAIERAGYADAMVIGGSARAILEALEKNSKVSFRDFDVGVVARGPVTEKLVERISVEIAREFGVEFTAGTIGLRIRERYREGQAEVFNAGFGSFIKTRFGEIDLSVFRTTEDLGNNGLLSWDRIRIPMRQNLALQGLKVVDPNNGWSDFKQGKLTIANWASLEAKSHVMTVRLLRDMSKNKLVLDEVSTQRLRKIFSAQTVPFNLGWLVHNLDKLLAQSDAVVKLRQLSELGFFKGWASSLDSFLQKKSDLELKVVLAKGADFNIERFGALWSLVGEALSLKERIPFLKGIAEYAPEIFFRDVNFFISRNGESLKVAYFTGDFGPFHKGHKSVVETAIKSRPDIDLIFALVIPHPREGAMTPEFDRGEWSERVRFTQAGLEKVAHAVVPPWHQYFTSDAINTQGMIDFIDGRFGANGSVLQIAGADSLIRLKQFGYLDRDVKERFIVTRPGVHLPDEITKHPGVQVVENLRSLPTSSTWLMQELAAGVRSEGLDPLVYEFVMQTPRYVKFTDDLRKQGMRISELGRKTTSAQVGDYVLNPFMLVGDVARTEAIALPQGEHLEVLKQLDKKGLPIYVLGRRGERAQEFSDAWLAFTKLNKIINVLPVLSLDEIPNQKTAGAVRNFVLHSGDAVRNLEHIKYLVENPSNKVSFYGIENQSPLPPVLDRSVFEYLQLHSVQVLSCRRLFQ